MLGDEQDAIESSRMQHLERVVRYDDARSRIDSRKQRDKHRRRISWLLPVFPVLPVIQVFVNVVLVALDALKCFQLSLGASYYVSTSTAGSLVLIGFFVRGLFAESAPSSEPKG